MKNYQAIPAADFPGHESSNREIWMSLKEGMCVRVPADSPEHAGKVRRALISSLQRWVKKENEHLTTSIKDSSVFLLLKKK